MEPELDSDVQLNPHGKSNTTNNHLTPTSPPSSTSQATIRTPRLTLTPYKDEHSALTKQLDQTPSVMKHIGFGRPLTDDETAQVHAWLLKSSTYVPGLGTWVAYAEGREIGWWILAATPKDPNNPTENFDLSRSETGYRILPEFWGRGYATEGSRGVLKHAFEGLGLDEVFGETMTVNHPSRRVMDKCGMRHAETWFSTYPTPPPGIEEGEVRYRITRNEWEGRNT